MKNLRPYLAGPINGCTDDVAADWRNFLKENYFPNAIDPMKRDYRGVEDQEYREIVDLDKKDIRDSDLLIVNYVKPSVGTSMEVFYAWTIGKPIIVVAKPGERISPWLRYHSTTIVHSFQQAVDKAKFYLN